MENSLLLLIIYRDLGLGVEFQFPKPVSPPNIRKELVSSYKKPLHVCEINQTKVPMNDIFYSISPLIEKAFFVYY